ncbi:MAG: class I tRNA ligase family protein, partial [Actinobacteria bacterium]|nr:class I tRNA ligase family protein [Actinomycetota bacterium]
FLRYCSPHLEKEAFDRDSIKYWMPVDQYIGGIEHATMHLIYSRFFTKALYDSGLIDFKEPFTKYYPHGVVTLGGQKMSKSKGNIVNPSEIYNKFGADTLRLYILFIGPADCLVDWNNKGVEGANRFLKRLWRLVGENIRLLKRLESKAGFNKDFKLEEILKSKFTSGGFKDIEKELYRKLHQAIKKVTIDILERFNFNTKISAVMELVNLIKRYNDSVMEADRDVWLIYELSQKLLILLSPIIPFITEELWDMMGKTGSIHRVAWPSYDKNIARSDMVIIVFQVNGKLRDRIELPQGTSAEELENAALSSQKVRNFIEGRLILKKIVVPDKLVNIVVQS